MITVIADRLKYSKPPSAALVAATTADYVSVRQSIRVALDRDEGLTVYVTDPVVLGWLSDLQRYPESSVSWHVVDPREEFCRLFGVNPIPPFSLELIAALQLDTLPHVPAGMVVNPLSWILGHRLDSVWQHDIPSSGHSASLAEWAVLHSEPLSPELITTAQAQLDRWSVDQPIYRAFRAISLADDATNLLIRWALRHYESGWRRSQPWGSLPLLNGEPSATALLAALEQHHESITRYWHERIAAAGGAVAIDEVLEQMSGLSEAELDALDTMLSSRGELLDSRLLHKISSRFMCLPGAQPTLRRLAEQVAPPRPPLPEATWGTEQWLRWATQQYMPYYAWSIRGNRDRQHQQECALRYSDWLHAQYPSWLNDERSPLLLRQYQDMSALLAGDDRAVVIWLIIDGMTWWQGNLMRELCESYGLHTQSYVPGIAALPSITSVSKRALVTGQPTIDLTHPTIAESARVKLDRSAIPAVVGYNLPAAVEALRQDETLRVAVVLFNTIDVLAHQTAMFTDNSGIRGYLEELALGLQSAQQMCRRQGRRVHVLIGSDHGSTLLPENAVSVPPPLAAREIDDVWEPEVSGQEAQRPGTRAAATESEQLPSVNKELWYTLDRDRFQLDRHYLVPRGYGYIKRRPTGWTHGGLTPEETIVPLLHVAAERPQLLPIEIEFRGTLVAGKPGSVTVVLRNLNPFPVEGISLTSPAADNDVTLQRIDALVQHELELDIARVMTQGADFLLTYELDYTVFGNPHHDSGQARIALRRLQTKDTSFEDMFS